MYAHVAVAPGSEHRDGTLGGSLINLKTGKRFWTPLAGRILVAQSIHVVDQVQWQLVQSALDRNDEPPVWYDFLFSAEQRLERGELETAVLDAAIASEAVFRRLVDRHLAESAPRQMHTLLTRVNISNVIGKWHNLGFESTVAIDKKRMQLLFDIRNNLMHRGVDKRVARHCKELCAATRMLITDAARLLES